MRYIHFRDDFSVQERFYTDDGNGGKVLVDVPEHVEISYFTSGGRGCFTAKRDGDNYENCELSVDGKVLTVNISLRERPIGHGRLLKIATNITEDASFPDGLRYARTPGMVDAVLYLGKTDGALDLTSEIVFGSTGVTLEQVWTSLQNNTDFPNEKFHLAHIPSLPISRIEGLQEALDSLDREIPSLEVLVSLADLEASLSGRIASLEAWVESPTMEEAWAWLLNVEELNGVRAFLSGELSVEGMATILGGLLLSSTRRIYFGDTDHYLELTSDGEFHFSHGVFSDDFITADGGSSHGGGGGSGSTDLVQVWTSLANQAVSEADITSTIKIATDHIPDLAISKITGLQTALNGKQGVINDLESIRSNASHGNTAYGWGDHSQAGYLLATTAASTYATIDALNALAILIADDSFSMAEETASLSGRIASMEAWVESPTMEEAWAWLLNVEELNGVRAFLSGELSVEGMATILGGLLLSSTRRIYFGDTDHYLELTSDGEFHFSHGVFSDDFITADGGSSHGGGGGSGSTDLIQVWASLTNQAVSEADITSTIKIATDHIPDLAISKITGLQTALNGKQGVINDLESIRSNASHGNTAYGWGDHSQAGYLLATTAASTYATIDALNALAILIADDSLSMAEAAASLSGRIASLEAWLERPAMDEAWAWLLNVEELNGIRAFLSGELSVEGMATILGGLLLSSTRRIYFGDTDHYLELTSDGEFHFSHGVFSDDFITADGGSSHGGGGGSGSTDLIQVWASLANQAVSEADITSTIKIATDHIPDLAISKITGLQTALNGKQGVINDLESIRSNASHGNTAYGWGDHSQAGYLLANTAASTYATIDALNALATSVSGTYATINALNALALLVDDSSLSAAEETVSLSGRIASMEAWVESPTMEEAWAWLLNVEELNGVRAFLSGELSVEGMATILGGLLLSSTRRIYFGDTDHYLELTSDGEFHFSHGVFSDDFITADGGSSHGGGGSGSTDLVQVWASLTNQSVSESDITSTIKIATDHIPDLAISKITGLQTALNGKQGVINDLESIRSNASHGNTAYGWGNHAQAGYLLSSTAASTYATINALNALAALVTNDPISMAEMEASLSRRIASLEYWVDRPTMEELYTGILDTNEIDLAGIVLTGSDAGVLTMNGSPVFSSLSNSGSQIAITIGGQTRTITVGYASSATNDGSGRNIASTYQTIAGELEMEKAFAEGLGNMAARVSSLEGWFNRPEMGEAFIQLLNVEEINGLSALLSGTLDVSGYSYFRSRLYIGGSAQSYIEWDSTDDGLHFSTGLYSDDYITADGGVATSSDARLKKNLQDVKLTVSQIAKTRAVTFDWIDEKKGSGAGTIAQDWEDLLPNNVHQWSDDMLSLEYGNAALISAIVIAREVEEQNREIRKLEKRISSIERQLKNP